MSTHLEGGRLPEIASGKISLLLLFWAPGPCRGEYTFAAGIAPPSLQFSSLG